MFHNPLNMIVVFALEGRNMMCLELTGLFSARDALQRDTGFRRYDELDVDFWHYDTVSDVLHDKKHIFNKDKRKPQVKGLAIRDDLG